MVAGTLLDLPEPERASQMAKATRNPAYTRIFELEMGYPALELYTPVYQEGRFLGVIGGVYSCERILQYTVPEHVLEGSRVSLAYDDGRIASTVSRQSDVDARFSQTADLSSFGYGIQLILERYRTHFLDTQVALLILLCVVLSCGLSYGMWAVSREAVERSLLSMIELGLRRKPLLFTHARFPFAVATPDFRTGLLQQRSTRRGPHGETRVRLLLGHLEIVPGHGRRPATRSEVLATLLDAPHAGLARAVVVTDDNISAAEDLLITSESSAITIAGTLQWAQPRRRAAQHHLKDQFREHAVHRQ